MKTMTLAERLAMADDEEADDGDAAAAPAAAADAPPAGGEAQTLAFPSLAHDRGFAPEAAAAAVVDAAAELLGSAAALRLIFVERDGEARRAVEAARDAKGIDAAALAVVDADIAALRTTTGSGARYVGNAADHKLSPRASGVNKRLHAAVDGLDALTKAAHAPAAEPGRAYPVDLPAGCALRETEGVHCIMHCCAPNLNPNKPNALDGDDAAARGKQMLAATYKALFSLFKQKCAA